MTALKKTGTKTLIASYASPITNARFATRSVVGIVTISANTATRTFVQIGATPHCVKNAQIFLVLCALKLIAAKLVRSHSAKPVGFYRFVQNVTKAIAQTVKQTLHFVTAVAQQRFAINVRSLYLVMAAGHIAVVRASSRLSFVIHAECSLSNGTALIRVYQAPSRAWRNVEKILR